MKTLLVTLVVYSAASAEIGGQKFAVRTGMTFGETAFAKYRSAVGGAQTDSGGWPQLARQVSGGPLIVHMDWPD